MADRVTRIFGEVFAEGTPNARVTRGFEEVFAEGSPNARVTRGPFVEVFADPGLTPDLLSDETFFTPQAVYNQTAAMPLLSDEAFFTPSWTQFLFPPLLSDEALFTPVMSMSQQQTIFT
jgi:hypothetical protein